MGWNRRGLLVMLGTRRVNIPLHKYAIPALIRSTRNSIWVFQWPVGVTDRINQAFENPNLVRPPPRYYQTPPYVKAEPEVVSVDLVSSAPHSSQAPSASISSQAATIKPSDRLPISGTAGSGQKFLVLATDGLWDALSSEEVVALVGGWLDGVRGSLTRREALARVKPPVRTLESPHAPRPEKSGEGPDFVFEDQNISTHLIRNALGGKAKERVSTLLSIPAPFSRRYRDDVSVPSECPPGATDPDRCTRTDSSITIPDHCDCHLD